MQDLLSQSLTVLMAESQILLGVLLWKVNAGHEVGAETLFMLH
jgi:hypothetical protein